MNYYVLLRIKQTNLRAAIISILLEFYTIEELAVARTLLISKCESVGLANSIKNFSKRRHHLTRNDLTS